MINDCLNFRVVRKMWNLSYVFFLEFDFKLTVVFLFVFSIFMRPFTMQLFKKYICSDSELLSNKSLFRGYSCKVKYITNTIYVQLFDKQWFIT